MTPELAHFLDSIFPLIANSRRGAPRPPPQKKWDKSIFQELIHPPSLPKEKTLYSSESSNCSLVFEVTLYLKQLEHEADMLEEK